MKWTKARKVKCSFELESPNKTSKKRKDKKGRIPIIEIGDLIQFEI